jgi:hypothetical protein
VGEVGSAVSVGEKAIVTDAMETIRQGVKQKAPDEFVGGKRHYLGFAVVAVVVPAEADLPIGKRDQPAVGDGDAMGVAAKIGHHLLGAGEGTFGIDHPVDAPEFGQDTVEDRLVGEWGSSPKKDRPLNESWSLSRNSRRKSRESTRTGRKKPGRQAIQRVPSLDRPPPGTRQ